MSTAVRRVSSTFSSTDSSTAAPGERDGGPAKRRGSGNRSSSPPARGLTEAWVADAAHREDRYEVADPVTPGLRLRVAARPGDAKTWVWYVVDGGKRQCITLGRWPATSVDAARVRLAEAKAAKADGRLAEHLLIRSGGTVPAAEGALLFRDLAEDYFRTMIAGKVRHPGAVRTILDNDVIPNLGGFEVAKLTTRVLRLPAERAVARGAEVYAAKILQITKAIVAFAVGRGDLELDVGAPLRPRALGIVTSRRRDRTPGEAELGPILAAVETLGEPTRTLLRLLLFTGVRTGELLRAPWSEFDLTQGVWTLPPARQKLRLEKEQGAKPWRIPLAPPVVAMLKHLRSFAPKSPWVAASSDSKDGHMTDKVLARALRRLQGADQKGNARVLTLAEPVSPHDFRRALRGWLARNGCPLEVAERCLGHSLRALGGVVATYSADDLFDVRREWMARWAAHLESHHRAGPPDAKKDKKSKRG